MPSSFSISIRKTLERCAIPGIIRYVVAFNALVFILQLLVPGFLSTLILDPALVLHGQVWRLITWIFIPQTLSPFWICFALLFLFYIGDALEAAIGSAKLTFFYLTGILLCTIVAFGFGLTGFGIPLSANTFLNLSLLLAYATIFPNFTVLVFFIIPMRVSWMAIISAILMIFACFGQPPVVGATLGAAFLNFFLFFHTQLRSYLASLNIGKISASASPSAKILRMTQEENDETLHRCETCGRTELSHPDLDFRVAANGSEYCREHLPKQPILPPSLS